MEVNNQVLQGAAGCNAGPGLWTAPVEVGLVNELQDSHLLKLLQC